jgi:NADPH-dependent 2,4-dienoyl-CoA reductase/sulfur reductase-like enzyme/rhodanese-related sulfurtransferase
MRIVIIGGVAAGTSAAAKARRNDEGAEIVIYDKDIDISYGVCGIPYAVGGEIPDFDRLAPRGPEWFKKRYNIDVFISHEVEAIDHTNKRLRVRDLTTGETKVDTYDILVFATGSSYKTPPLFLEHEYENMFRVKNIVSGRVIRKFIETHGPKRAVVVGAGYIGLEMTEQLMKMGIAVTLIQRGGHAFPAMDADMAVRIEDEMDRQGVVFLKNQEVELLLRGDDGLINRVMTSSGQSIDCDMVVVATGVKANVALPESIGVMISPETGAVQVGTDMQTNLSGVYAVGDVAESYDWITGKPVYRPLATTANKMGRIAGDAMTGGPLRHRGVLSTGILRFFDQTVAQTGLTEDRALAEGYDIVTLFNIKPDKPDYYFGQNMVIKAVADKKDGRVLGAQIIGPAGVDKRIDVFATAISFGAKAEDLFHLDLAYTPTYSTTKDPVNYTGMALTNALNKQPLMDPKDLLGLIAEGADLQIIDARDGESYDVSHVDGAISVPLSQLRDASDGLDKSKKTIVYCNMGVTGNAAQNILLNEGFKDVYNLSGGNMQFQELKRKLEKE